MSCNHDYEIVPSTKKRVIEIALEILEEEGIDVSSFRPGEAVPVDITVWLEEYFMAANTSHKQLMLLTNNHMPIYDRVCLNCGDCKSVIKETELSFLKMRKNRLQWENRESTAEKIYLDNCKNHMTNNK